jgi:hypothetical protein
MLAATVLGIFFVPVFYVVVRRIFKPRPSAAELDAGLARSGRQTA